MQSSQKLATVVRIGRVFPYPDPTTKHLEIVYFGCDQFVVGKSEFKEGDLAVLIMAGTVVPQTEPFRFIWGPHSDSFTREAPQGASTVSITQYSPVSAYHRRIHRRRFRKQWSDGLLVPLKEFVRTESSCTGERALNPFTREVIQVGDDVSQLVEVRTWAPRAVYQPKTRFPRKRSRRPQTLKGWFFFLLSRLCRKLNSGR